jgi:hypothetical protein
MRSRPRKARASGNDGSFWIFNRLDARCVCWIATCKRILFKNKRQGVMKRAKSGERLYPDREQFPDINKIMQMHRDAIMKLSASTPKRKARKAKGNRK